VAAGSLPDSPVKFFMLAADNPLNQNCVIGNWAANTLGALMPVLGKRNLYDAGTENKIRGKECAIPV
jgi:hypothetical protein